MSVILTCLLSLVALWPPAFEPDLTDTYRRLHAAEDAEGLAELWREHPGSILVTIDADLEASLSIWEADPGAPDEEAIAALHARAVWAAEVASATTGRPIFIDYAAAFVGWNDQQKQRFRGGQQSFARARAAAQAREFEAALEAAVACRDLALPLGDWWGSAMGYAMEGRALLELERTEEAIAPLGQARLIYQQLGLTGSEYGALRGLVDGLADLGAWERVRVSADAAVAMARKLDDFDGQRLLLGRRREAELALGLEEQAQISADALDALEGEG